jgi:branched-chain amino acid transport system substrate-binding protein
VLGEISYGKDGEWAKSRQFFTQFQGVVGNDLAQFRDSSHQVILWPSDYRTGNIIYPYERGEEEIALAAVRFISPLAEILNRARP